LHSSQLIDTSLQKARGTTSLCGPWAALHFLAFSGLLCFCNNKNVLRAQSMVWHFVRHPVCWQFKLTTYGSEPSVNDASDPNKQIYQKCSATKGTEALHNISQFVVCDITLKLLLITLTSLFSLWRFRGPSRSLYHDLWFILCLPWINRKSDCHGSLPIIKVEESYFVSAWQLILKWKTWKVDDELRNCCFLFLNTQHTHWNIQTHKHTHTQIYYSRPL